MWLPLLHRGEFDFYVSLIGSVERKVDEYRANGLPRSAISISRVMGIRYNTRSAAKSQR